MKARSSKGGTKRPTATIIPIRRAKSKLKPKPSPGDNTIAFPRAFALPFDPVPGVVAHVERLLADAKAGRLRALVYGVVWRDDISPAGAVDHGFACSPGTYYAASHAVERLRRGWDRECESNTVVPADRPPDRA